LSGDAAGIGSELMAKIADLDNKMEKMMNTVIRGRVMASIMVMVCVLPGMSAAWCADDSQPMEVTIYYAQMQSQMEPVLQEFKVQYPNITVHDYRAIGEELNATMEMEIRSGNPQFDVVVGGSAGLLGIRRRYAPFGRFEPRDKSDIIEALLDKDGVYMPIGIGLYVIEYNSKQISRAEAPKSWAELLDGKWLNKISIADPKSSSSVYGFIWFITQYKKGAPYGWDYFNKLQALRPHYAPSHGTIAEMVALGERLIGVQNMAPTLSSMAKGDPVSWVFPTDGVPSELNVAVVRKDTPNFRSAQLFVDFLLSKDGQGMVAKNLNYIPVRQDMDYTFPDGTRLSDLNLINRDDNWIADNREDILERFRVLTAGN
jgi:iron(III) transport system substrate-binding protein